jgi:EmrB/QacA subfamily drug resistance transporter
MSSPPASRRVTRRGLVVLGLILALAMAALEATVVSTAMPTVIGELGGIHHYAWVANAYLVASSVTVPLYGKLADIHGRKPVLLAGILLFLVGSAASGAATSMETLIVFRAIQGLGAGSMQPIAITVAGDIFDLEERARIQGLFGAAWGLFGLIGPLLGGFIVAHTSWRWVFYMNLPFGVAALVLLVAHLHETIDKQPHRLDLAGAGLLTIAVSALLLATSRPALPLLLAASGASLVFFVLFVLSARRAPEPVLPLDLILRPVIGISNLAGAIVGGAMIGTLTYVPLYVQGVMQGSPTDAGSAITPMVVGWPIASALSGRLIPKIGFRLLIRVGLAITAAAGVALALESGTHSLWALRITTAAFGVGMGLANTALILAIQTSVAWNERGVATASSLFARTIGGALAVGAMGGILNAAFAAEPSLPADAASAALAQKELGSLDPALLGLLSRVLAEGLQKAFWLIAVLAIIAFVVSLWFPKQEQKSS